MLQPQHKWGMICFILNNIKVLKFFQERTLIKVINNETYLLYSALCYEEGHCRRTQHILKVYALAKLLGEQEKISTEDQQILQAAAILHDIAIKYCKKHYNGDASQEKQKKEASHLVQEFLQEANYLPSYIPKIVDLVSKHHDYRKEKSKLLQILIEADLIVNCYENQPDYKKSKFIKDIFQTTGGKKLLELCLEEGI